MALGNAALSVEGEVKELKSMFAEMLKRLDPHNTPSNTKMSSGAIKVQKGSLGAGTVGATITLTRIVPSPGKTKPGKKIRKAREKGRGIKGWEP